MRINTTRGEMQKSFIFLAGILYNNQPTSIGKLIEVQSNQLTTITIGRTLQITLFITLQGSHIERCRERDGLP